MFSGLPPFLGDASYIDFNIANSILSGNGFSYGPNINGDFIAFGKRPPGFSIIVAFIMYFNIEIITAAMITTVISYALLPVFVFLSCRKFFSSFKSFLVASIVLLHPSFIYFSKIAAPEIIGVLILSLTLYIYLEWIDREESNKKNLIVSLLLGFILGITIWFRYANGIYVLIFSALIFFYACIYDKARINAALSLLIGGLISISLLVRNFISTGNLTGHPINNVKTNDMDVAIVKSLNVITNNKLKFDVNSEYAAILFIFLLFLLAVSVIVIALKNKIIFKLMPIAIMPLAYLLFFTYIQSTTRVDDVSTRYLLPFILSAAIQVMFILYYLDYKHRFSSFLRLVVLLSVVNYGYASIKIGSFKRAYGDKDYSPETINYILNNIEKGSVIIGNRFLAQLFMHSVDYSMMGLKFYSRYNKDYGRKLSYDKEELLEKILKHNIKYLVIFTGSDKKEHFLARDDYGEFITSIVAGDSDIIKKRMQLNDGMIIQFKEYSDLESIYNYFKNELDLLGENQSQFKVKVDSSGQITSSKEGIYINDKDSNGFTSISLGFNEIQSVYAVKISYKALSKNIGKIQVSLNDKDEFALYEFNKNQIKFDRISLRDNNMIKKTSKFSMDNISKMKMKIYTKSENKEIKNFKINSITFYTK